MSQLVKVVDRAGRRVRGVFRSGDAYYFRAMVGRRRWAESIPIVPVPGNDKIREVRVWVAERLEEIRGGRARPAGRAGLKVGELLGAYEAAAEVQRAATGRPKVRTVGCVRNALLRVLAVAGGVEGDAARRCSVSVLSRELARRYLARMVRGAGPALGDQARARLSAMSMLNQARCVFSRWALAEFRDRGLLLPEGCREFADVARSARPAPYRLPPAELRARTLAAARVLIEERDPRGAAFVLCHDLGLRSGEAVAARWEWFEADDDGRRWLRVGPRPYWEGAKNRRERRVPVPVGSWNDLTLVLGGPGRALAWILPGQTELERQDLVQRDLAGWMRGLGWDRARWPKAAHELRKLAASRWCTELGIEWAARYLGDTIQTTAHYYADLDRPGRPVQMR